jgi:hypothetical protein
VRLVRPVVTAAALACLAGGISAQAAAKPVCKLVTDDAGDASIQAPLPNDDSLDIISGDVASNAKNVTTVIRLKNLSGASLVAQTGRNYYAQFDIPGSANPVYFSLEEDATGQTFNWGDLEPGAGGVDTYTRKGEATGVVDTAKNEIRVTVPVSDLSALGKAKPGTKFTALHFSTTAVLGVLVSDVDTADATKSYVAGTASCVKPGK